MNGGKQCSNCLSDTDLSHSALWSPVIASFYCFPNVPTSIFFMAEETSSHAYELHFPRPFLYGWTPRSVPQLGRCEQCWRHSFALLFCCFTPGYLETQHAAGALPDSLGRTIFLLPMFPRPSASGFLGAPARVQRDN